MLTDDLVQNDQRVADDLPIADLVEIGIEVVLDQTSARGQFHQDVEIVFEQVGSDWQTFGSHLSRKNLVIEEESMIEFALIKL